MSLGGLQLLLFFALGAAFGAGYLTVLAWNVGFYCGGSSRWLAASIHLLRLLGTAGIFVAIARMGAAPLLWSLAGFQLTRIFGVGAKVLLSDAAI
jgi:hypothetical protein